MEVALVRPGQEVRLGTAEARSSCPLELVDDLARLQLVVQRLGWSIRLRHPSPGLAELLDLVGLDDVLLIDDDPCT